MSSEGTERNALDSALEQLGGAQRWAWPEQTSEEDPSAGAVSEVTVDFCRRVASELHVAAKSPCGAAAALTAVRAHLGAEIDVARRFDEVLSVEAGCVLARGHVAAEKGMTTVADMIRALLQLEDGMAEHLSNHPGTTAGDASFNARRFGILLLPTLLECTLAGLTKCWDCDWGVLGKQIQPLHDLVLKQPLLDHASTALLQLVWLRAPVLLPLEPGVRGGGEGAQQPLLPQCIYGLACLSQEIHDRLLEEGLQEANSEEMLLMAHVRREVLKQLGQVGRWQRESAEQVCTPPSSPKKRPAASPKSPAKRAAPSQVVKRSPGKKSNEAKDVQEAKEVQDFLATLVEKYGCEDLVGSFMERVEKALGTIAVAAAQGRVEAAAAEKAAMAAQKLADLMGDFQVLLSFGPTAKGAVQARLPYFVRHLLETSAWDEQWRHMLCDVLELVIHPKLAREASVTLWAQVGEKWLEHASASRLTAVGSLATVLAGVLAEQKGVKAAESWKCMQNLRYSAASCLLCFQQADPKKPLDGKIAAGDATSAEEEEGPTSSRPRCSDELSEGSEEIGSQDTLSPHSDDEHASDLESFEDDAAEFNDCGFLDSTSPQKLARHAAGSSGAASSAQPETNLRYKSNLVSDWKERVKEILKKMPPPDGPKASEEKRPPDLKLVEKACFSPLPHSKGKIVEEDDEGEEEPALKKARTHALLDEPGACSAAVL